MSSNSNQNPVSTPEKYPGYWQIKRLRRALRNRVNTWLARRTTPPPALTALDPAQVRRVIVCRRNNRLGNMLFLLPLLRSLGATLPHAQIDVLIGNARYARLFRGLPGVRRIWTMPPRGWSWPLRMLYLFFQIRAQDYDLSIEPSLNSFSNRLSARFCGARWRLSFHAPGQWLGLTHTVVPDANQQHEILKPLQLVREAFAGAARINARPEILLDAQERAVGRARLAAVLGNSGNGPVIGFFIEATGRKRLPQEWWRTWTNYLLAQQQDIRLLQILPPGSPSALHPDIPGIHEPDLRMLAALLSQIDLFVSCDAGPMHLARAAGTPTIGLFQASKSDRYRPLGQASLAIEVGELGPVQVAQAVALHLQTILPNVNPAQPVVIPRIADIHGLLSAHAQGKQRAGCSQAPGLLSRSS